MKNLICECKEIGKEFKKEAGEKWIVMWFWCTSCVLTFIAIWLWCDLPHTIDIIIVECILCLKIAVNCGFLIAVGKWKKILFIIMSGIGIWGICSDFVVSGLLILTYVACKMAFEYATLD